MLVAWLAVAACAAAAPLRVSTFQALEAAASRHGDVEVFVAASPLRCDREIAIVGNVTVSSANGTLDGGNATRFFRVAAGASLLVKDTGLRNGYAASGGGGQGRKRVIQRRFNVSVPRACVSETAPTLRERSER